MSQPTCRLVTLGCKVNQYETELVREALVRNGYREAGVGESADLCVVNTCTVTTEGDAKSRQAIRQLSKQNPGTRTVVMGCYATRDPLAVAALPDVVDVVTDKRELPDLFDRLGLSNAPNGISRFGTRKRAFVKVQDGCILKCSYCIIPFVRPGLRSRSVDEIEEEVRRLVDNGYLEIVLCGIHVGHYGVETTRGKSQLPPFRLWHLFRRLDKIPGNWRMRLSSVEAAEIHDDFISAARDCEHLCPQFHPALQSGSNGVLRRMRRRYSVERFLEKLEQMRERLHNPTFTTDVIVGFPGETEAEYAETEAACRAARFLKVHVFPFSARKGVPAASMPGQVTGDVIRDRARRLGLLERELAKSWYEDYVGQNLEVLVESPIADRPGWMIGSDRRYLPIMVPGSAADQGKFVTARGIAACDDGLLAERIDIESVL